MMIELKHRFTRAILFRAEDASSVREALEAARADIERCALESAAPSVQP
jgi:hypothetical protein